LLTTALYQDNVGFGSSTIPAWISR
jgi:hypothetical protein